MRTKWSHASSHSYVARDVPRTLSAHDSKNVSRLKSASVCSDRVAPIHGVFARVVRQTRLGVTIEESLDQAASLYSVRELSILALSVAGADLQHVKPHGILYNMMEKDEALAVAAGEATLESGGTGLILMTLASGKYDAACRKRGVRVASEGFADRAYNVDGTLVSRKIAGSLITDPARAAAQAVTMAMDGKVRTLDGVEIDIAVQTICCHGDTPGAERIVRAVREGLEKAGCRVRPLRDWLPRA